jgi:prolyl-tRNA synthetase
MKVTQLLTKTNKNAPADEQAKNAQLLIRAGYIHKEMAGVYSFLPLGLRVLNNVANIVREEMDKIGGQEILMPALQIQERYEATNRWDDEVVDNWFKTKLKNGTELGLGFSHEENLSPIVKNYLTSYKELPLAVYQVQTKFRNELRSKSGIMRGREFLMKDMYSYALNQKQHDEFYEKAKQAYVRIFERLGLGDNTFITFASGGSFSKYSHEFQTLSDAGEDTIYLSRAKNIAINREVLTDEVLQELDLKREDLEEVKAIEVGNIFSLGTKFSTPFDVSVVDEHGEKITTIMGCYGIGISRVMGTIAEMMSDEKGIVWPKEIAPYRVYLAALGGSDAVEQAANEIYTHLTDAGISVIYDDRKDVSAGGKFADADLLGIPYRVVISEKTIAAQKFEIKERTGEKTDLLSLEDVINTVK